MAILLNLVLLNLIPCHSAGTTPLRPDATRAHYGGALSQVSTHSWANAGVLLGDACIGSGVAFEAI